MKDIIYYNECIISIKCDNEPIHKALVSGCDQSMLKDFTKYEEPQQEMACKGLLTVSNVLSVIDIKLYINYDFIESMNEKQNEWKAA